MSELVQAVVVVSDGILVEFGTGECCYYPASFLLEHQFAEPNHVFLNYDPSPTVTPVELASSYREASALV